ncbi:MAG TPA: aldehyde dehydrogenase family protein, partial [Chitinophagaceae bacterium]|nr:aldehyde dehydrogenase family protein [Chitinophagaceae bacterium]
MEFLQHLSITAVNEGVSTGTSWLKADETPIESFSPVDGRLIASVSPVSRQVYDQIVEQATAAFKEWQLWPSPKRGEIVRQIGEALRNQKEPLGKLVSYEMGKSLQEGLGEVQEMIDICDFAVGLSRQLHGLTMHSERPGHRMYEQYHPLGVVAIISAFNFPVAVWSWNAMLAWVCGDVCIWKPSEKTPLCAVACQKIVQEVFSRNNVPEGVSCLVTGNRETGEWLSHDPRIALVSATGSTKMGKAVSAAVGARLGRSLLELGGNNAIIVTESADLDIALPACVFGAVGTAGQRCTSTRRLIIQESIYDKFKEKLVKAYGQLRIGDPLDEKNHVGPLIDKEAVSTYLEAIETCKAQGGRFI